jgi:hypothetical protein
MSPQELCELLKYTASTAVLFSETFDMKMMINNEGRSGDNNFRGSIPELASRHDSPQSGKPVSAARFETATQRVTVQRDSEIQMEVNGHFTD